MVIVPMATKLIIEWCGGSGSDMDLWMFVEKTIYLNIVKPLYMHKILSGVCFLTPKNSDDLL